MSELYERDFHAWTEEQAALLRRAGSERVDRALDYANLAEEIESLGRNDRRALQSGLVLIVEHLLKLQFSPAAAPRVDWRISVRTHRRAFRDLLADNPGLRQRLDLDRAWRDARATVVDALRLRDRVDPAVLPAALPYSFAQITDEDWYPAVAHPDPLTREGEG